MHHLTPLQRTSLLTEPTAQTVTMHSRAKNGDEKDLQLTLGSSITLQQAELTSPFDLEQLLDTPVLYKWDSKNAGGWFVGKVIEIITDANRDELTEKYQYFKPSRGRKCNAIIEYEPDDSGMLYVGHTLEEANFTGVANASVCSWGLPVEMQLSNYQGQYIRAPCRTIKLGRPQSACLAPLIGPTAKSPRKRQR